MNDPTDKVLVAGLLVFFFWAISAQATLEELMSKISDAIALVQTSVNNLATRQSDQDVATPTDVANLAAIAAQLDAILPTPPATPPVTEPAPAAPATS